MSTSSQGGATPGREAREPLSPKDQPAGMPPLVLDLQRLLQDRLSGRPSAGGATFDDEIAVVSVTSCDHHSCA